MRYHKVRKLFYVYTNREEQSYMAVAVKDEYQNIIEEQKRDIRNMVLAGIEQISEGKTKDFDSVCNMLEKKYKGEEL